MSQHTKIEWTDATWNPMRGCSKISPGCKHCYAETFAERFRGLPGHPFEFGFDLRLVPERLTEPLKWVRPRIVFVNSMSDLFHESVPDEYIVGVARVMAMADWHIFQVLTKRSSRLRSLLRTKLRAYAHLRHIWWGVSVEDRRWGVPRIRHLQTSPAAVRFLSIEPLLEDLGSLDLTRIDWVIVGGESGPGARPMLADWVDDIRNQCDRSGIPFFFKQWGGVQKRKRGRLLHGRTHDSLPPVQPRTVPPSMKRLAKLRGAEQISRALVQHNRTLITVCERDPDLIKIAV